MPQGLVLSYIEKDSFYHKLNPLTKTVITVCAIILSFVLRNFTHNLILFSLVIPLALYSKMLKQVFKPVFSLWLIFVLLFTIQGLFYPYRQTPLFELPFGLIVWKEGVLYAANISSRLLVMMVYGYLFVLTTHPGDLVSALRELRLPHRKLEFPYSLGYLMISTMHMIPQTMAQMSTIIEAQRSRGLDIEGSVLNRLKAYVPLTGPLFLSSVQQAVERSVALEARGFSVDVKKTSYRKTRFRMKDKVIIICSILFSILGGVLSWVL